MAKSPTQFVDGISPKYLQRGKGCHVWDVDNNEYIDIDLVMGVGTLSLGTMVAHSLREWSGELLFAVYSYQRKATIRHVR